MKQATQTEATERAVPPRLAEEAPLLMIPGPVTISPGVAAAAAGPPPAHTSASLVAAFGAALDLTREVWTAAPGSQPFVLAGAGTLAMEMAATNLIEPGDRVLTLDTGFFAARMGIILRRLGAEVVELKAAVGDAPTLEQAREAIEGGSAAGQSTPPFKALFAAHVDTSTGVRLDPEPLARLGREHGLLTVFDGVCAAGGERFAMAEWDVDVYFSASQKALGLPPGLALMVASERALAARAARRAPLPTLYLDWESWRPIMRAYEERKSSYFSTPATSLVRALEVGLREILAGGLAHRFALHGRAGRALRAAWGALGLAPVAARAELAADTVSTLYFPRGVDNSLIARIQAHGVTVASGRHPAIMGTYFRIGHMGWVVTQPELLRRTAAAVAAGLADCGHTASVPAALAAADAVLAEPP
ncbi:MAG TPA: aminotransferase class V-fold PLP-dependent enzyme [Thermoanaerobaculia bacterium]|nr:aminotransferase class V-fold PLP-dependent enzyme [Thermoanaerobaculia bacterium]